MAICADRHAINHILDEADKRGELDGPPRAKLAVDLGRDLPLLLRHELCVAGRLVVVLDVHRGKEIAEFELADLARHFQVEVEIAVRFPRDRHEALRPDELACLAVGPRLRQFGILRAERALQAPGTVELAAVGKIGFGAALLDACGAFGQRGHQVAAVGLALAKVGAEIEEVECALSGQLNLAVESAEAVLAAQDALACFGALERARAGAIDERARLIKGFDGDEIAFLLKPLQPDQLQAAWAKVELVIGAEFAFSLLVGEGGEAGGRGSTHRAAEGVFAATEIEAAE